MILRPVSSSFGSLLSRRFVSSKALPPTIASLDLKAAHPSPITINGWIRSIRKMKNVSFASISDGSAGTVQAVLKPEQGKDLTIGTSVSLSGKWQLLSSPNAKQPGELVVDDVTVLGNSDPNTYPIQKKYHTVEYLRSVPALRFRTTRNARLLRLRSHVSSHFSKYFEQQGFLQTHPPVITSSDCEGAGEVFTVVACGDAKESKEGKGIVKQEHFFKEPKYLTVSTQLHLEALAAAHPRVWTLSPTFRAEKSDTNRHLSEFYMLEAEVSFITSLDPLLDLTEKLVRSLVASLRASELGRELEEDEELMKKWGMLENEWKRMTYSEAMDFLQEQKMQWKVEPKWESGLGGEHEKFLAQHFGAPVFVTDYPAAIKPFYMLPSVESATAGPTSACFDLILPYIGELVGGSLREHRYEPLVRNMVKHGLCESEAEADVEKAGLRWYAELRKWGSVPHGGFGLGMDRLLAYLGGEENVREVTAWPRWAGRCEC